MTYWSLHRKLPRAITFDLTVGFLSSISWKWRSIQGCQDQPGQRYFEAGGPWMAATSKNVLRAINSLGHPSDRGTHIFLKFALCLVPLYIFVSSKHQKNAQKHSKKHIKVSWFFLLHQEHKVLLLHPIFFSWFYAWDLGFRGVDVAFLAVIHTPNLLDLFSSIYLSFY